MVACTFAVTVTGADTGAEKLQVDHTSEPIEIINEGTKVAPDGRIKRVGKFIVKSNKLAGTIDKLVNIGATIEACQTACNDHVFNFEERN